MNHIDVIETSELREKSTITGPNIEFVPVDVFRDKASWLALRRQDVTASEIGAVCGLPDAYKTPLRVYAEKTGLIAESDEDNPAMQRGRWMEPAVVAALEERFPTWTFRRAKVYIRDRAKRMGCTPDVVAIDPERKGFGVVQCKTVDSRVFNDDWEGGDKTPLSYDLQTLQEAKLSGATWALLATIVMKPFGQLELHLKEIDLHEGAWARICKIVDEFWGMVASGTEPAVNYVEDAETIKKLYPEGLKSDPLDLSKNNQILEDIATYQSEGDVEKAAKKAKEEASTRIRATMRDYTHAILPDGRALTLTDVHTKEHVRQASTSRRIGISKTQAEKDAAAAKKKAKR